MTDSALSTRPILKDNDNSWNRVPYQVEFGDTFMTMADSLRYMADVYGGKIKGGSVNGIGGLDNDDALAEFLGMPKYIGKPFFKDTRLGANDAINCIWQFNRDDDIVHEMLRSDSNSNIGMGRVYAATTEQNQSLAWVTFGVPRFTQLATFYKNAFSASLIKINNTGFDSESKIGHLFGTLGALAFSLPILPIAWFVNFTQRLHDYPVDRFYDLRATMHIYYRYVDSILAEWLVNTGLYGNGNSEGALNNASSYTADPGSLPAALRETGVSIWDILARKARMLGVDPNKNTSEFENDVAEQIKKSAKDYDGATDNPWNNNGTDWTRVLYSSALGATQFLAFRIEKNVDASETFSNSTGPSAFAEQINSMARDNMSKAYDLGFTGSETNTGIGWADTLSKGFAGVIQGAAEIFQVNGLASATIGGAFIDIPEQYKSSDFNKSHSLSFQLRAPYGDIVSIYQSIMVPLACILAGVLPRAAGPNSYTQPFLCRWYCKGLFSIPLGIIDSVTLKRGASEFGWTYQNLPTCIDVSLSIKDLSPMMYMAMKDESIQDLLGANNSFNEYMLTLAGTGLFERVSRWEQIRRKVQLSCHKIRNQVANPLYWTNKIADSAPAQFVAALSPWNKISHG